MISAKSEYPNVKTGITFTIYADTLCTVNDSKFENTHFSNHQSMKLINEQNIFTDFNMKYTNTLKG